MHVLLFLIMMYNENKDNFHLTLKTKVHHGDSSDDTGSLQTASHSLWWV